MGRINKKKSKQKGHRKNKGGGPPSSPSRRNDGNFDNSPSSPSASGKEHQSMYAQYKEATRSFRNGLSKLIPDSIPLISVSDLGNAVEYVLHEHESEKRSLMVGVSLLSCLNKSIKLREEITISMGDMDEGHAYMIGMLRYCQTILRRCREIYVASQDNSKTSDSCKIGTTKVDNNDGISDRFEALKVNDDDDDESEEDDDLHIERPSQPDREYSIEKDLIDGNDTMHAKSFIFQTNVLMEMIGGHFRTLKAKIGGIKQMAPKDNLPGEMVDDAIALHTMICSACVNLALEEMKYIEEALVAEAPSLKTFYHVVTTLIFLPFVTHLESCASRDSLKRNPSIVLDFIAKEVEYAFRTPVNKSYYNYEQRATPFVKRTKIELDQIVNLSHGIQAMILLEATPHFFINDERMKSTVTECRINMDKLCNEMGMPPSGMSQMWNIFSLGKNVIYKKVDGDDNNLYAKGLLHTQCRLQMFVHTLPSWDDVGIMAHHPNMKYCEPKWDENDNKTESIDDIQMDDFFFRIFNFPFINHVRQYGKGSQKVFDSCFRGMLPRFFPLLQGYLTLLENRDSPVPYSLTLFAHAMMLGVLHLQGDLERIALASKNVSDKYYSQIQKAIDQSTEDNKHYLEQIKRRQVHSSASEETSLLVLWNPLCAGCFLGQITYQCNIMMSSHDLDLKNQTLTILHLLNAFKARKILQEDDIEYLKQIETALSSSKAIWGEQKPTSSFCSAFFIASGFPISASKKMADFIEYMPWHQMNDAIENASEEKIVKLFRENIELDSDTSMHLERMKLLICISACGIFRGGKRKKARTIQPKEISSSYECIVERDFSGLEDFSRGNEVSIMSTTGHATSFLNHYYRQKALQEKIIEDSATKLVQVAVGFG